MNNGFITEINGCISTGKEANVYHASGRDGKQIAMKIYKTSILVFKDRDKYVTGEFRYFSHVCSCISNLKYLLYIKISTRILQAQPKKNGADLGRKRIT